MRFKRRLTRSRRSFRFELTSDGGSRVTQFSRSFSETGMDQIISVYASELWEGGGADKFYILSTPVCFSPPVFFLVSVETEFRRKFSASSSNYLSVGNVRKTQIIRDRRSCLAVPRDLDDSIRVHGSPWHGNGIYVVCINDAKRQ